MSIEKLDVALFDVLKSNMNGFEIAVLEALFEDLPANEIIALARIAEVHGSEELFILELAGASNPDKYDIVVEMAKESLILKSKGVE